MADKLIDPSKFSGELDVTPCQIELQQTPDGDWVALLWLDGQAEPERVSVLDDETAACFLRALPDDDSIGTIGGAGID